MKLKQGSETTNEDFIKTVMKEIKVYKKYGGNFLWGLSKKEQLVKRITVEKEKYRRINGEDMGTPTEKELEEVEKIKLKERIIVMAVLKRTNKKRFRNLQIDLKNKYLLGIDKYPTSIGGLLKVLNHYKPKWSQVTTGSSSNTGNGSTRRSVILT